MDEMVRLGHHFDGSRLARTAHILCMTAHTPPGQTMEKQSWKLSPNPVIRARHR